MPSTTAARTRPSKSTRAKRTLPSRSPVASSKSPAVDAYIARVQPFAQPILKRLRAIVHRACPGVTETIKWGMPAFDFKGPLVGMAAFKAHCVFGFWKHALLDDPDGVLQKKERTAMGNFGCLRSMSDLPADTVLARLIKSAVALNEKGVKLTRSARATKAIPVPADFAKALRASPKALATFDAFAPSHRREYIEWIVEAKRAETRTKRIKTAIEWLAQGKGRNWRYEPKKR